MSPRYCVRHSGNAPGSGKEKCPPGRDHRRNILFLSDGLKELPLDTVQTVICAGMGGDCIIGILEQTCGIWDPAYQFILQPQSSAGDLRKWLGEHRFSIVQEHLAQDGKFIYTAMEVRYGDGAPVSPGYHYLSKALLERGDPLLGAYAARIRQSLQQTVTGLRSARVTIEPQMLSYYETALLELTQLEEQYEICE